MGSNYLLPLSFLAGGRYSVQMNIYDRAAKSKKKTQARMEIQPPAKSERATNDELSRGMPR
jgi:hypothetical protein